MSEQSQHRQWIYARHPEGLVVKDHYELRSQPLSLALSAGEVLVQAVYISVDPYMRINQSKKPTYNPEPHPLGVCNRQAWWVARWCRRLLICLRAHGSKACWAGRRMPGRTQALCASSI